MQQKVVIVAGKRTPIGSFQGQFSSISASDLGSNVVKKLLHDFQINPTQIEEIILGNRTFNASIIFFVSSSKRVV